VADPNEQSVRNPVKARKKERDVWIRDMDAASSHKIEKDILPLTLGTKNLRSTVRKLFSKMGEEITP
jgi:hypothetical protein